MAAREVVNVEPDPGKPATLGDPSLRPEPVADPVLIPRQPCRRLGLPVLGPVAAPEAVLIRPDGPVAWLRDSARLGLTEALTTWFGPARAEA